MKNNNASHSIYQQHKLEDNTQDRCDLNYTESKNVTEENFEWILPNDSEKNNKEIKRQINNYNNVRPVIRVVNIDRFISYFDKSKYLIVCYFILYIV